MHQTENGYTRIANTLLEELAKRPIHGNCMRVILWAIRNSYGYNRKRTNPATLRTIAEEIKMSTSSVHLAIQVLCEAGILVKKVDGGFLFDKNKLDNVQPTGQESGKTLSSPLDKSVQPTGNLVQPTGQANVTRSKENSKDNSKERKDRRFTPPTLDEVRAYCLERKNNVDPERWYAYYQSNGWKVGRNPMKDWKAAVRTWERPYGQTAGKPTPELDKYLGAGKKF